MRHVLVYEATQPFVDTSWRLSHGCACTDQHDCVRSLIRLRQAEGVSVPGFGVGGGVAGQAQQPVAGCPRCAPPNPSAAGPVAKQV